MHAKLVITITSAKGGHIESSVEVEGVVPPSLRSVVDGTKAYIETVILPKKD